MTLQKTITNSGEQLLRLPEASKRLGVSVWTLRAWIQSGKIESNKLGGRRLISLSVVERLIAESRVPAFAQAD